VVGHREGQRYDLSREDVVVSVKQFDLHLVLTGPKSGYVDGVGVTSIRPPPGKAAVVEEALAQSDTTGERRTLAELLRLEGEVVMLQDVPNVAAIAVDHFQQSLDWARRQGTLAWELRSATRLARPTRNSTDRGGIEPDRLLPNCDVRPISQPTP
jgi:hypothetical protein